MARINQDLSGISESDMDRPGGWKVKEDGEYRVMVSESEYKPTSKGDGMCLHLKLAHLNAPYIDDYEMVYLTLEHPKEKVRHIAKSQLKELALAVRHPTPDDVKDSNELHGKPFVVRLYSGTAAQGYGDSNGMEQRIGAFKPTDAVSRGEASAVQGGETSVSSAATEAGDSPF